MIKTTNNEDKSRWIVCKDCGHKLGRVMNDKCIILNLEIKCSSCKKLNTINYFTKGGK